MSKKNITTYIWNGIGITFNSIYSIIIMFFLMHYANNGIELSGRFSYAFYICSLFYTIGNYGGRILQISDYKGKHSDYDYIGLKYFSNSIMIILLGLFVLVNGYSINKIMLLFVIILYRVFEAISDSYYGVMQKNDDLIYVGISMTIKSILSILLFIVLQIVFNNIVISSLSFFIVFFIVFYLYDKRICKTKYNLNKMSINIKTVKMLKECFLIFIFSFLVLLTANLVRYFVDLKLTDIDQGYFAIIILPASMLTLLGQFLIQPLLYSFVNLDKDKNYKEFNKKLLKVISLMFIFGLVLALFMDIIGTNILGIIYNIDLNEYRHISALLVGAGILNGVVAILSNMLTILDKKKEQILLFLLPIIITIVLFFFIKVNLMNMFILYFVIMLMQFILFMSYYFVVIGGKINEKKH